MISQLRKMDHELSSWRSQYQAAVNTTQPPWLASKFAERAATLDQMEEHIWAMRDLLVDFPRLS